MPRTRPPYPIEDVVQYRVADLSDIWGIKSLLEACLLPVEDLEQVLGSSHSSFIIASCGDTIVGSIGMEQYDPDFLLRSFAVAYHYRGSRVYRQLMNEMEKLAVSLGVKSGYLLTTTTTISKFMLRYGFQIVERADIPNSIKETQQFASICPVNAICLVKRITGSI